MTYRPFAAFGFYTHRILAVTALLMSLAAVSLPGASYYTARPNDPSAVMLSREAFPTLCGDGQGDDTDAIQSAIEKVASVPPGKGVVLIPEGRYRLSRTIQIPPGIRLLGYGARRPVLVLGPNTPGFQQGERQYMVWFTGGRFNAQGEPRDANPSTFYSALANIDFEVGAGNPAAICVRAYYAQHCYLAHIDFFIGSGRAGLGQAGNEAEDLHFHGGDYGILTRRPSPSWQFTLLDSTFDGQRLAAIRSQEAGLTLVRDSFRAVPSAVGIDEDHAEELWMKDCRMEDISGPALIISDEKNAQTEINLENVVCAGVPTLARFRESGKNIQWPGAIYLVKEFSHGLRFADIASKPELKTVFAATTLTAPPAPVASDIPALPPVEKWASIMDFGAKGDGLADDLPAFQKAIEQTNVIFLPKGLYRVSEPVRLRPDTILIGLNPITTQIAIRDGEPAFCGAGPYQGVVESSAGGSNIVQGIGLDSGANNSRAVGLKWMAGAQSLASDVKFLGGHGTYAVGGGHPLATPGRRGDLAAGRDWDSEGPSLLVTQGGGGTFANIWTASTFAECGLCVEHTTNSGRIYELSSEHHVRKEVRFRDAANWQVFALQTEEEWNESPNCLPLDIQDCSRLTFANLFMFRVVGMSGPFPYAASVSASRELRFRNLHVYSQSKFAFDNPVFDRSSGLGVRAREIGALDISGAATKPKDAADLRVLARGAKVEKLAGGFSSIDNLVADSSGNAYFLDARWQSIYRFSPETRGLTLLCDDRFSPAALAMDKADNLLVVSRSGNVCALNMRRPDNPIESLAPIAAANRSGKVTVVPGNRWYDWHTFLVDNLRPLPWHFVSPDGSTFIPAPEAFLHNNGRGMTIPPLDLLRTYSLVSGDATHPVYVADEFMHQTWVFDVKSDGSLFHPRLFAEEGEAGTAVDGRGNVYIAAGNIHVYDASGRSLGTIEVPERPTSVLRVGGAHPRLFIAARSSLYSVRLKF